jgi:hypothetical protein
VVEELFSPKLPPLFYLFSDMGYVFFLPCLLTMWHAFIGSMHLSTLGGTSFFIYFSAMPSWVMDLFSHGAPTWVCFFYSSLFL